MGLRNREAARQFRREHRSVKPPNVFEGPFAGRRYLEGHRLTGRHAGTRRDREIGYHRRGRHQQVDIFAEYCSESIGQSELVNTGVGDLDVGDSKEHPTLCTRCIDNIEGPGEHRQYA